MNDYPEINCPKAYDAYHGKSVLFRVRRGKRVDEFVGRFFVSPTSKWMRIDSVVEQTHVSQAVEQLPIDQTIVQSILPAPMGILDAAGAQIDFVIPLVIVLPHPQ